jgi:hypothetical protein
LFGHEAENTFWLDSSSTEMVFIWLMSVYLRFYRYDAENTVVITKPFPHSVFNTVHIYSYIWILKQELSINIGFLHILEIYFIIYYIFHHLNIIFIPIGKSTLFVHGRKRWITLEAVNFQIVWSKVWY